MNGIEGKTYTINLMILAEMYGALDRCKHGFRLFEGCNLLLQVWLLEHFHRGEYQKEILQRPLNDYIASHHPKKMTFIPNRFAKCENVIGCAFLQ